MPTRPKDDGISGALRSWGRTICIGLVRKDVFFTRPSFRPHHTHTCSSSHARTCVSFVLSLFSPHIAGAAPALPQLTPRSEKNRRDSRGGADGRQRPGADTMPASRPRFTPSPGGGSPKRGVQSRPQNAGRGRSSPADSSASAAAPGTSPEPQQIGPDDFRFVQIVGRGSYGVGWEAVKIDTRETYAIKVLEKVTRLTPCA